MPDPRIWPIPSATDSFTAVGPVSTQVLAANPNRVDAEFINDSASIIYLARGNDAVVGSGIRLNANGGSYGISTTNLFLGVINAIADIGEQETVNLAWSEGNKP